MTASNRNQAAAQGREALEILKAGHYIASDGTKVDIRNWIDDSIAGTVSYPEEAVLPSFGSVRFETRFEVQNETTLNAAQRLTAQGLNVVALNFASAKHPGGGFLRGARAQEESLCRSSALYGSINGNPMYATHGPTRGGFYTNAAIYSPAVPVFRNDSGELMPTPFRSAFVTAPAVNAGTYLNGTQDSVKVAQVSREMAERIDKVLTIMAGHGHDAVVLGAWGCGVFRNDPEEIAGRFREALVTRFAGAFRVVSFAVLDGTEDRYFIGPFENRFGN